MKCIPLLVLSLLFAHEVRAASFIEGNIKLYFTTDPFGNKAFKREFGEVIRAKTEWYVGEFFGQETLFGGAFLTNTGSKPMYFNYYAAFFDKDQKLVGAALQDSSFLGSDGLKRVAPRFPGPVKVGPKRK